jgi:hypothetical protein
VIVEANPEGFFESPLRNGINFRTNPDPKTGVYLHHGETRNHVVKVFVPGLVRSDMAFLDKVLASMRPFREYHASIDRLFAMEQANRKKEILEGLPPPIYLPGVYEWWAENFSLLSDFLTRGYPIHMVAYDTILDDPEPTVREAIEWLGAGDPEAAVAAVKPTLRTQRTETLPTPDEIDADTASLFDELYARVRDRTGLDGDFIDALNAANDRLEPKIAERRREAHRRQIERRRLVRARRGAMETASKASAAKGAAPKPG